MRKYLVALLTLFAFAVMFNVTANFAVAQEQPSSSKAPEGVVAEEVVEQTVDGAIALLIQNNAPWGRDWVLGSSGEKNNDPVCRLQ